MNKKFAAPIIILGESKFRAVQREVGMTIKNEMQTKRCSPNFKLDVPPERRVCGNEKRIQPAARHDFTNRRKVLQSRRDLPLDVQHAAAMVLVGTACNAPDVPKVFLS